MAKGHHGPPHARGDAKCKGGERQSHVIQLAAMRVVCDEAAGPRTYVVAKDGLEAKSVGGFGCRP